MGTDGIRVCITQPSEERAGVNDTFFCVDTDPGSVIIRRDLSPGGGATTVAGVDAGPDPDIGDSRYIIARDRERYGGEYRPDRDAREPRCVYDYVLHS